MSASVKRRSNTVIKREAPVTDTIGELLAILSPEEQRELSDRLAYKLSRAGSIADASNEEQEVWDALHEALAIRKTKFENFVLAFGRAKYREACMEVVEIVQDGSGENLRIGQCKGILVMGFQCLEEILLHRGIPVSPAAMLRNCGLMRFALDQSFPGYCKAKLLHKIVQLAAP